jgi:hypothetical protein
MSVESYTDAELRALDRVGRRRTLTHLLDLYQTHLSEYVTPGPDV